MRRNGKADQQSHGVNKANEDISIKMKTETLISTGCPTCPSPKRVQLGQLKPCQYWLVPAVPPVPAKNINTYIRNSSCSITDTGIYRNVPHVRGFYPGTPGTAGTRSTHKGFAVPKIANLLGTPLGQTSDNTFYRKKHDRA